MGEQGAGYEAHAEFQNAGQSPGLEIWRIEVSISLKNKIYVVFEYACLQ